jgi:arginase
MANHKIRIIEVKSEIGAGTRGASLGPDAIKIAALDLGSDLFKRIKSVEVPNYNHLLFENAGSKYAKYAKGLQKVCDGLSKELKKTLDAGEFPLILAGDHSTSAGTIAGLRAVLNEKYGANNVRLGVIWVDAHADIHSPYTTPSGNMHGMPLAISLGVDNEENIVNHPDEETLKLWEEMKNMVTGESPKIRYTDLVYIAMRDFEPEERSVVDKQRIKWFKTGHVKQFGVERIARDTLAYLRECTHIYISFDVDSMDSSISKGTGTPVRNGITEKEAGSLLVRLIQNEKVCCFEVCEVNPTLDKENLMAENTFEIITKVVAQLTT